MSIPSPLDDLILSCLAKEPSERPDGAEMLAARLDAMPLDPVWSEDRARDWWENHKPVEAGPKHDRAPLQHRS
jgi:hypothetical protein